MAENKKSVVIYTDLIHTVEQLPDDKAGLLFKHVLRYINDLNPVTDDIVINIAFEPIKQQLKRDLKKWEGIREKRSDAGKASAESRKQKATKSTSVKSVKQTSTKSTVSVNANVNVNDTVIKEEKIKQAEFVFLLKSEYEKLISDYGKVNADKLIKELDNYKGANGKKYKSDYRAILSWVVKKVLGDNYHSSGQQINPTLSAGKKPEVFKGYN